MNLTKRYANVLFLFVCTILSIAYYFQIKNRIYIQQRITISFLVPFFLFFTLLSLILEINKIIKEQKFKNITSSEVFLQMISHMSLKNEKVLLVALLILYIFVIYFFGFYLSSLIFIPLTMYIYGIKNKYYLIILPIVFLSLFYVGFQVLLRVEIFKGILLLKY